jgi:hypothetical protein
VRKEYVTFVPRPKELPEGEEIELVIRDLAPGRQKYDAHIVKAIVSSADKILPDSDILWIRSSVGVLSPTPWFIKITKELDEFIPSRPWAEVFEP